MQHKKLHHDFLAHAESLLPSVQGRPDHVTLRRCISCCYYASFHALCFAWSKKFSPRLQEHTARCPNHIALKQNAGKLKSSSLDWLGQRCCDDMEQICEDFIILQEMRHKADYDPFLILRKDEAIESIERATRLIEVVGKAIRGEDEILSLHLDAWLLSSMGIKKPSR